MMHRLKHWVGSRLVPAWRPLWLRLRDRNLQPTRLALSAGVGAFIGLLPIPGMQTFVWLGLVALLPIDPIVSYAFTWVSNPITVLPFTVLELELGSLIVTRHWLAFDWARDVSLSGAMHHGTYLLVGGVLLGTVAGTLAFGLARVVTRRWSVHPHSTTTQDTKASA